MAKQTWKLFDTKYLKAIVYYHKEDRFLIGITINFKHTQSVTCRRGLYFSLLGFTIQIYQNN
jgi:hypothetical protein